VKHRSSVVFCLVGAALLGLAACGAGDTPTTTQPTTSTSATVTTIASPSTTEELPPVTLTLLTHDSFAGSVTNETFAAFTSETGVEVRVLAAGDAGAMVNQAVLTKDNPIADVLFGIDDTFLSRGLDEGIFTPFRSSQLESIPDDLELDPEGRVTPIDYGDVCLNYDLAAFEAGGIPPFNLEQLLNPEFADMLVVEDPSTSSTGLAFLLATIASFGEDGWQRYWEQLIDNGAKVVPDWNTAYYSEFSRYGGDRPIVVSYATSPVAEFLFADPPVEEAPTAVITEGCYRQIEFAGILAGTEQPAAAGLLIDYLASPEFQSTIPLTWFVLPANERAEIPVEFTRHTTFPEAPLAIDSASVAANRDRWIREWSEIVLP
jgi:thiamine transport system substrate-binding protein